MDIIPEDHRLESPTTPLLDDVDGSQDSPIFMYAPEFKFMPPPTYTEVRIVIFTVNICPKPSVGSSLRGGIAKWILVLVFTQIKMVSSFFLSGGSLHPQQQCAVSMWEKRSSCTYLFLFTSLPGLSLFLETK